jgi:hypothetical protein
MARRLVDRAQPPTALDLATTTLVLAAGSRRATLATTSATRFRAANRLVTQNATRRMALLLGQLRPVATATTAAACRGHQLMEEKESSVLHRFHDGLVGGHVGDIHHVHRIEIGARVGAVVVQLAVRLHTPIRVPPRPW